MKPNGTAPSPLCVRFTACPLCNSNDTVLLRTDRCDHHPLWQPGLPDRIEWMHCQACQHVYSRDFFNTEGLALLFSRANATQVVRGDLDFERSRWAPSVERIQSQLAEPAWLTDNTLWLDIGCGSGGLVITATEYGFHAIGMDTRQVAVQSLIDLGYDAALGDLTTFSVNNPVDVVSLADVLEHVPYPRAALQQVHAALRPKGLVMVSCPNLDCGSWRKSTADGVNPYWGEIEHHHNFSRASLMRLLAQEGFIPLNYSISPRYKSCMEVIAQRA